MTKNELVQFLKEARKQVNNQVALTGMELYPLWEAGIEITETMITEGENRFRYNGHLWETNTAHTTQADWYPRQATASIWTIINVEHTGTLEDPIPAFANMEYEKGKYYIENEVIYLMSREGMEEGEKITLQYTPSQLVGIYFTVVS